MVQGKGACFGCPDKLRVTVPGRAFLASFRDAPACGRGTGGVAVLNPRLRSDIPPGWEAGKLWFGCSDKLRVTVPGRAFLASFRDAPACGRGTGGVAVLNPRLRSDIPPGWEAGKLWFGCSDKLRVTVPGRAFLASFRDAPACGRGTGGVAVLNPRLRSDIPPGWETGPRDRGCRGAQPPATV
jgi:hypothetical protein